MSDATPASRTAGRALLLAGCAAAAVLLAAAPERMPGVAWLPRSDADWLVYPHVPRTRSHPVRPLEARFEHAFSLDAEAVASLELGCLDVCEVAIDGRVADGSGGRLGAGRHTLSVRAVRDDGPPAFRLWLCDEASGRVLVRSDADARWIASLDGATALAAARAARPLRPPAPGPPPIPWRGVLGVAVAGAAAALLADRLAAAARGRRLRFLLPVGVAGAWVALLAANLRSLDAPVGFDVEHHLSYLRFVLERAALPLPTDGVQTYQPPLFYLLAAGWLRLLGLGPGGEGAVAALRALTFALGLAHLLGLHACVRRVLPEPAGTPPGGRTRPAGWALVFAAAAPVHLALFHAFTNEALVVALSTAAVWALLRASGPETPRVRDGALVGVLVGAALLAKLSALVLVPVALGALIVRAPRGGAAAAALGGVIAVAGAYYGWIASVFGTPFVGNWDARVGFAWWQDPGLRDVGAYARFGGALVDPWLAGFDSVWDGVYSTFFADGLASGEPSRLLGPPWRHGHARVVVWLGLLPAALVALGAVRGLRRVWRRPDAAGLALVGLGVAMATAFVWMTLRVPSYAQSKAIYWSPGFVPLFGAFALGVDVVLRRSRLVATVATAGLGAWAALAFSVFWIDPDAPDTLRALGERALAASRPDEAGRWFARAADGPGPAPVWAEVGRCRAAAMAGRSAEAARACETALARAPDDPDALFHAARLAQAAGHAALALDRLERLRAVAPLDARLPPALAAAARRAGRPELVREAAREWLRLDPGSPAALRLLASPARAPVDVPPSG